METNIQCYITEMPSIVKNLFIDKNVRNIYVESRGNGYFYIEPNVSVKRVNVCTRCGGSWLQRSETMPKRCPLCTSPYWQRPRMSERSAISKKGDRKHGKGKSKAKPKQ